MDNAAPSTAEIRAHMAAMAPSADHHTDIERIRDALHTIPPDDRDTWVRCAMAIKDELGEAGRIMWDTWSQGGDNYNATDARDVWRSVKPGGGVTIASLFEIAKRHGWRPSGDYQPPSAEEQAKREAARRERDAAERKKIAEEQARASDLAARVIEAAGLPDPSHPYLQRKGITDANRLFALEAAAVAKILGYAPKSGGERLDGVLLIAPIERVNVGIVSLELIDEAGRKAALRGRGTKAGGWWTPDAAFPRGRHGRIVIAEGIATTLSLSAALDCPCLAALSVSNMAAIAELARERNPAAEILVAADLEKSNAKPHPSAVKAAKASGAILVAPDFGEDRPQGATDWNDVHVLRGLDAVKSQIEAQILPTPSETPATARDDADDAQGEEPQSWPDPDPLRAPASCAEPYPLDALGELLGGAVQAIHEVVKAPLALCAQSALAAASFAAQAHFDAKMPWGEVKPTTLFLLTVGESGERKSAVDDLVLGAAKAQEREAMAAFEDAEANYESELEAWKEAIAEAKKRAKGKGRGTFEDFRRAADEVGEKPNPPVMPLRFVSDPTAEGLYKLLAVSQPSVALFSDEAGLLIGGHALNSDNAVKTISRWSKMWDGSPFDRVRAGDGSGILYGRRMALHQLAQPVVMSQLLGDEAANGQGFLARCLVAWPESTIGTRHIERFEWAGDRAEVRRLFGKLKGLFEAPPRTKDKRGQVLDPIALPLAPDATQTATAALNQFESLMADGQPLCELRDRTSKALENAVRLAAVLTVAERGIGARDISLGHLQRALVLMQWYLSEALRIRGTSVVPQAARDAELLLGWLKDRRIAVFRSDPVLRGGPPQLRNKERFTTAVLELMAAGYLRENEPGALVDGVAAKRSWRVNPNVF